MACKFGENDLQSCRSACLGIRFRICPRMPTSPSLFAAEEWRTADLTREDVVANAMRAYHPEKERIDPVDVNS